jgi:hypothetical protein
VRVAVTVGDITVDLRGVTMTNRQVRDLVRLCVESAHDLPSKPDPENSAPIGFTASTERASEYVRPDFDWVDDEE